MLDNEPQGKDARETVREHVQPLDAPHWLDESPTEAQWREYAASLDHEQAREEFVCTTLNYESALDELVSLRAAFAAQSSLLQEAREALGRAFTRLAMGPVGEPCEDYAADAQDMLMAAMKSLDAKLSSVAASPTQEKPLSAPPVARTDRLRDAVVEAARYSIGLNPEWDEKRKAALAALDAEEKS